VTVALAVPVIVAVMTVFAALFATLLAMFCDWVGNDAIVSTIGSSVTHTLPRRWDPAWSMMPAG
jgi:hypothetical protein